MSSNVILKKIKYFMRYIPDKTYLQIYYFLQFGKLCDFKNPTTFNEKLNWLKINNRDSLYTKLVDKYEVKEYVEKVIGGGYTIPTFGVWEHFDDINFDMLPNQFVLKCTHDSEGLVIVKDKSTMDKNAAREKIETALKHNFYYVGREWPYKNVHPRIIAEQYMEDHIDKELRDYKFYCFDGIPKIMYIASNRNSGHVNFDFYDMEFNHLDITQKYPNASEPLRKPEHFKEMIGLAKKLSNGFPHVRVDFYEVDGKVYFGELTFFSMSGLTPFKPAKWDKIMGSWLTLPQKK